MALNHVTVSVKELLGEGTVPRRFIYIYTCILFTYIYTFIFPRLIQILLFCRWCSSNDYQYILLTRGFAYVYWVRELAKDTTVSSSSNEEYRSNSIGNGPVSNNVTGGTMQRSLRTGLTNVSNVTSSGTATGEESTIKQQQQQQRDWYSK
jgi:hypothetical protein